MILIDRGAVPPPATDETRRQAAEAVVRAGFLTPDLRLVVHTFSGVSGADWDVSTALRFIAAADVVEWPTDAWSAALGHGLRVTADGLTVRFQIPGL